MGNSKVSVLVSRFKKVQSNLLKLIEKREEIHGNRSEKWQESERGEFYYKKTEELEEAYEEIEAALGTIVQTTL